VAIAEEEARAEGCIAAVAEQPSQGRAESGCAMTQHYTRSTVEASAWCNECGKMTAHRVADKRLQYCIPCFEKPVVVKAKPVKEPELQGDLFEERG
jgi:hypothetical protein